MHPNPIKHRHEISLAEKYAIVPRRSKTSKSGNADRIVLPNFQWPFSICYIIQYYRYKLEKSRCDGSLLFRLVACDDDDDDDDDGSNGISTDRARAQSAVSCL